MEDRRARSLNGVSGSLGSLNFDLALVPSPSPTAAWQRENEESSGSAESTLPSNWKVGVSGSSSMKREASLECMSIAHDGGGRDSKRRKLSGNIPEDLLECPVCWDFMFSGRPRSPESLISNELSHA
ncbi:hypothetical protein CBR_g12809 [Chara braunii]|uniref:Uncharacterized protein n=1 Tax=Chara braunii TaxID=69332 RepID=A0A388KT29_CHABU|nr:hypothetical protein CBR_g12809 [Chara braunii]|eukprot:GBG73093.1 hypothetical protein CBR_g12809 [Chara braunii]